MAEEKRPYNQGEMLLQLSGTAGGCHMYVGVCVPVFRGYSGAMGSIVKRTIGVKLG